MTAALRAQLDAIGEKAVEDALDTLSAEHRRRVIASRVYSVPADAVDAARAARHRLSLMAGEVGEHRYRPPMTAGRRASAGHAPLWRSVATTPASSVSNCPVCLGLGCNDCCHTGRATTSAAGDGASLGSTPSPAVST